MSVLVCDLVFQLRAARMPAPIAEYVFARPRRWRFDEAWPDRMLAVEVEGGTWVNGRHSRGSGMRKDCEKYNAAVLLGWRVLRVTGDMVRDGSALATIEQALT
jgi:hypothetical protein